MEKLVVKTAVKTVLIILGIFVAVFAVFNFAFPQHMASVTESMGNYDLAVKYASLRYYYTKNCDDLARCFDDSVLLGNDKYILDYGENLLRHKDYPDLCRVKNEQQSGTGYDYDRWVKGKLVISYYNTDRKAKAIETAMELDRGENGVLAFEYGSSLMALAARIKTGGDAEAAKAMLAALEEVTPADQTQAENLAQVKIAMNAVISSGK